MSREALRWWPPKVGAKLRRRSVGAGRGKGRGTSTMRVVAIFKDEDGEKRIVVAEWLPWKRRWHYEVKHAYEAATGLIWPDGTEKPKEDA